MIIKLNKQKPNILIPIKMILISMSNMKVKILIKYNSNNYNNKYNKFLKYRLQYNNNKPH